jgi:hypothetical protein
MVGAEVLRGIHRLPDLLHSPYQGTEDIGEPTFDCPRKEVADA